MHYDDYGGGIGSFCWYWYERIPGFLGSKLENPLVMGRSEEEIRGDSEAALLQNWGGTQVLAEVKPPASRLVEMFRLTQRVSHRPVKVSVGAGPVNLGFHVDYSAPDTAYQSQRELAEALAPIFNREMKALASAGCQFIQLEDLGGWLLTSDEDRQWVIDVLNQTVDGVDAKLGWHCCLGSALGNTLRAFEGRLGEILEPMYEVNVDQYVLDFALRDMQDVKGLASLPDDKEVAIGVLDIRTLKIESDQELIDRMHKTLEVVPPEQVWFSTDCGMKSLPRFVAQEKLKAMVRARDVVRGEL
jgi:5-methyltetrahydropteroyltriglutamate--homocysteine methyltransferase